MTVLAMAYGKSIGYESLVLVVTKKIEEGVGAD